MSLHHSYNWEAVGPSGGGQTIAAAISPHDAGLILVASDMGGIYRSADGGETFALLDGKIASRMCCDFNLTAAAFHPVDRKRIYMGVWNGLLVSEDGGETFHHTENHGMRYGPARIVFDPKGEDGLLVYNDLERTGSLIKNMAGKTLFEMDDLTFGIALWEDMIFVCGSRKQYLSKDGGESFEKRCEYPVKGFCQTGEKVYFTAAGGLFQLELGAGTLTRIYGVTEGQLCHVAADEKTIYVGYEGSENHFDGEGISTILKSQDGGIAFAPVLFQHPAHAQCNLEHSWISGKWGWYLSPSCMALTPADSDMLLYTNFMGIGITRDGGRTFVEAGARRNGTAIQVMTGWNYVIDPHDPETHYIAMTDFSGWRSGDAGQTWEHAWLGNPWKSNIYCIAPHPMQKGRLLAGTANVHDLPYWHWLRRQNDGWSGGIIQSNDYGKTWFPQDQSGMGPFGVVTDICYYKDKVFAAVLGQGLYVSDETERYWKRLDREIAHRNTARIAVEGDRIYVTVWPMQTETGVVSGTVYVSRDGDHFTELPLAEHIKYPVHVLSVSEHELYISCFDCIDNYVKGRIDVPQEEAFFGRPGVYHTADGGRTWQRIYDGAAYSTAKIGNKIYLCTRENGLYVREDGALRRDDDLPVINPHTVTSGAQGALYVTTFGQGVYRGIPREEDREKEEILR